MLRACHREDGDTCIFFWAEEKFGKKMRLTACFVFVKNESAGINAKTFRTPGVDE
jgi:hypothetical protein